jgi:hypothetical protein
MSLFLRVAWRIDDRRFPPQVLYMVMATIIDLSEFDAFLFDLDVPIATYQSRVESGWVLVAF